MNTREKVHQYWLNPSKGNRPETYIQGLTYSSEYLVSLISQNAYHSDRIIELGCNIGKNLEKLFHFGFHNLTAIEINLEAINLMKTVFPKMAKQLNIFLSSIEKQILIFKDNSFDIVFTVAVLQHIHPDSNFIFSHIVRITKKYLITMENEVTMSSRHYPRNYCNIFESLGMKQIFEQNLESIGMGDTYQARILEKQNEKISR